MFNITVVIPVLNRPKNVKPFIESFIKTTPNDRAELLFVTDSGCQIEIDEINKYKDKCLIDIGIAPNDKISWSKRINWGINYSSQYHHFSEPSTWLFFCGDDCVFYKNWFIEAEKSSIGFDGVIATNDLAGHNIYYTTHPIVSRNYIMTQGTIDGELGKFCHEGYIHTH